MTPAEDWVRCRPWIEAALQYADDLYAIEDVEGFIVREEALFWPGQACACVTQWLWFPRRKVLNYWLAGGAMDELLTRMMPAIERWALEHHDCTDFSVSGRPGWARAMAPHGFAPRWQVLSKRLVPTP